MSKAMTVAAAQSKARLLGEHVDLTVVIPRTWPGYVAEAISPSYGKYELVRLPVFLPGKNHFHIYRGLRTLLQDLKPHIIHIDEEPYSLVTTQIVLMARSVKSKIVVFTWQNIFKRYPPPFAQMEQYVYSNANAIIAGNREAMYVLRRKGYRGLIRVIPQFGINFADYDPKFADRNSFGISENEVAVAYVGRLVPEKGIDILLAAISRVNGMRLYIVGTGPEERRLKQLVGKLKIRERVHFLGGIPSTDIPRFMASVDILVLPSLTYPHWKEQFGRVLIEAMASGTALVGSDSGEIPQVIGDAGIVVPEGDDSALARALECLRDPEVRSEFVQKGLSRVRQFTQERIVKDTLNVYREILSE